MVDMQISYPVVSAGGRGREKAVGGRGEGEGGGGGWDTAVRRKRRKGRWFCLFLCQCRRYITAHVGYLTKPVLCELLPARLLHGVDTKASAA